MKDLKVEFEPTESLIPYVNNANIHTEEQIEQIANSINEFGFNDPIAVWTNENGQSEVVEGHGRVLAAKKLGLYSLPVIHLDTLSDEQRRAYTHTHNQLTRNSEFDWDMLSDEMDYLDFDWKSLGFDEILGEDEDQEEIYSTKTEGLFYEPTEEKPPISSLVDDSEYEALLAAVDGSILSDNEKWFLRLAACRFLKFDYEKIADYYCNSDNQVKEQFELLKLVILDKDDSIAHAADELINTIEGLE